MLQVKVSKCTFKSKPFDLFCSCLSLIYAFSMPIVADSLVFCQNEKKKQPSKIWPWQVWLAPKERSRRLQWRALWFCVTWMRRLRTPPWSGWKAIRFRPRPESRSTWAPSMRHRRNGWYRGKRKKTRQDLDSWDAGDGDILTYPDFFSLFFSWICWTLNRWTVEPLDVRYVQNSGKPL